MRTLPVLLSAVLCSGLLAQAAGLRGPANEHPLVERLQAPDPAAAERVITIEATAEVRVVPSRLRLVFAVSATDGTPAAASTAVRNLLTSVKTQLGKAGVAEADLDVDFIAALPVFSWGVSQQVGKDAVVEKRTGFRVQYNVHAAVADEAAARTAIEAATSVDGVDLLAVDYWSADLEQRQAEAQQKALLAAQRKAQLLLAVFPKPPVPINVFEQTHVLFPQQLYQPIPRVEDSAGQWYSRNDLPHVPASRPLFTYYRGLFADLDVPDQVMPGRREIEVVSTVRLYFAAPERPQPMK